MTKAVGAALVPEILAQSPPAVKVEAGILPHVLCESERSQPRSRPAERV